MSYSRALPLERAVQSTFPSSRAAHLSVRHHCRISHCVQISTLSCNSRRESEIKRLLKALADGAQVHIPLGKTLFALRFGMVEEHLVVSWIFFFLIIRPPPTSPLFPSAPLSR